MNIKIQFINFVKTLTSAFINRNFIIYSKLTKVSNEKRF